MEIKLFGKSLFSFKTGKGEMLMNTAFNQIKDSKFLPDFYSWNTGDNPMSDFIRMEDVAVWSTTSTNTMVSGSGVMTAPVKATPAEKKAVKEGEKKLSPKEVYELKTLHDRSFVLNTDPKYIDDLLASFKDKLSLVTSEEYDMRRGAEEISSMVARIENRKKYPEFSEFFEQYPHTTTTKISEVLKGHDHLKIGQVAQFVADMPKEAITAMKDYNKTVGKLCGKQAVFYIIADKKDFKKSNTRRDPILLAQSPFGHVWQIIGAWDEEMMFLEEL